MREGLAEPAPGGKLGVDVQRVPVPGQPVDQGLLRPGRLYDPVVGLPVRAFPRRVGALIGRALPWTAGLLAVSTRVAWGLGSLRGVLAGYYQKGRGLKLMVVIAMGLHPIPYYMLALMLLIVFAGMLPAGGGTKEMVVRAIDAGPKDEEADPVLYVKQVFLSMGMAKESSSAEEA